MLHCVASLHIGWYSPIKSEYSSLRRCSSGVSNDCFCTFLSLVDWIRLRNLTDCIAVHINKWGSLLDQCGNGHCQTSHFINPGISKCWNWSEMECDACAWSPGRPQSLSVATLIPSKPKCWGEPADFLKAWQEYIKQWRDATVNKYARTERWVSVCVVYCAADWNTMLYIQQVLCWPQKNKFMEQNVSFLKVYKLVNWQHSKRQHYDDVRRQKWSKKGIWAQMSKVSNTCMQGFMFHLPLSSRSGHFLCGGLAGHCTEVTITWEESLLIIPYHKTPSDMSSWLPLQHTPESAWVSHQITTRW